MFQFLALFGFILTGCYEKSPPGGTTEGSSSNSGLDIRDHDLDGFSEATGDCDDTDPLINPSAEEICNGRDDDCDGRVDIDSVDAVEGYADADNDGFGDPEVTVDACPSWFGNSEFENLSANDRDCDDSDPAINPAADELCDDIDSDCDPTNDDFGTDGTPVYTDADGDGFGVNPVVALACLAPTEDAADGFSRVANDCDDADDMTYPYADEYCNETDNDCDGAVDNDAVDRQQWFNDADGDGFGNGDISLGLHCDLAPMATNGDDCDDDNSDTNPDAAEVCDGIDNDCNGAEDEGLTTNYWPDSDGDTYGDATGIADFCTDPGEGWTDNDEDCNDGDGSINPGATDAPGDEIDQDCNGTELCFADVDDDGLTADSPEIIASEDALCTGPGEALATDPAGDCDDTDPALGSVDLDGDCDGTVTSDDCDDEDGASTTLATDADCDTVITAEDCDDDDVSLGAISADADCDGTLTSDDCDDNDPASTVVDEDADCDSFITADDCDDSDAAINPDAYDTLDDGTDNNCDGGDWVTCDGSYVIEGATPSVNISELEFCGAVTGSIVIDSTDLTDTIGLSRLRTVGGEFFFTQNTEMASIELPSLTSVGGEILVEGNDDLESLDLPSLTEIEGMLIIDNDDLTSIGIEDLTTASSYLAVLLNEELTSLEANSLTTVEALYIEANDELTVASLSALEEVSYDAVITDNNMLTMVDLSSLSSVGTDLKFIANASLTSVSMDSLTSTGGDLWFIENHALTSISMAGLEAVAEDLEIGANSGLESVVFSSISSIGEDLSIVQTGLETLSGFNQLNYVGGAISINMNPNLSSLTGFNNLETTTELWIQNHPTLDDITGFEALTAVNGSLLVQYNNGLDTISGFDSLTHIGEQLSIVGNDLLTSIDGLYGIDTIGGYLQIRVNALLCSSEVDAFVASIDSIFGLGSMHGDLNNDEC